MLKQRRAGDKRWPIACSDTTLGTADKELDLSDAHLSYGDFNEATFTGAGAINLSGASFADLSDAKLSADGGLATPSSTSMGLTSPTPTYTTGGLSP